MNVGDPMVTIYGGSRVKLVKQTARAYMLRDKEVPARWMVEYSDGDKKEFSAKELKAA